MLLLHTDARIFLLAPLPNNDHVYAQEWIRCIRESSPALVSATGDEEEDAFPEGDSGGASSPVHRRRYTEGVMYDPHIDVMPSGVLKQGWLQVKRKTSGGGAARSKRRSMLGNMFGEQRSPGATAAGFVRRFVVLTSTTLTVYKYRPKEGSSSTSAVDVEIDLDQVIRVVLPAGAQDTEPTHRSRQKSIGRNLAMSKAKSYHQGLSARSNVFQVVCFDALVAFQSVSATLHEEWFALVQQACSARQDTDGGLEGPSAHTHRHGHTVAM